MSGSALEDGLGHVIRTFGARSLKLRSKEVRVLLDERAWMTDLEICMKVAKGKSM